MQGAGGRGGRFACKQDGDLGDKQTWSQWTRPPGWALHAARALALLPAAEPSSVPGTYGWPKTVCSLNEWVKKRNGAKWPPGPVAPSKKKHPDPANGKSAKTNQQSEISAQLWAFQRKHLYVQIFRQQYMPVPYVKGIRHTKSFNCQCEGFKGCFWPVCWVAFSLSLQVTSSRQKRNIFWKHA